MLSVKKKKKFSLIGIILGLSTLGFFVHDYLAGVLKVFPNPGIGFGLSCNFLVCVAFLALIVMMVLFWKRQDFGLMIIIIGGLINFIDRIVFGHVRDYWNFWFFYNNLADLIIVFGVLYSLVHLWKKR